MFGWLFGKKGTTRSHKAAGRITSSLIDARPNKGPVRAEVRDDGRGWLSMPAMGFYGACTRSPNGQFRITWRDSGSGGGNGHYILLDGERIVCQPTGRPASKGHVAKVLIACRFENGFICRESPISLAY